MNFVKVFIAIIFSDLIIISLKAEWRKNRPSRVGPGQISGTLTRKFHDIFLAGLRKAYEFEGHDIKMTVIYREQFVSIPLGEKS
jgi:hypothetical protein